MPSGNRIHEISSYQGSAWSSGVGSSSAAGVASGGASTGTAAGASADEDVAMACGERERE